MTTYKFLVHDDNGKIKDQVFDIFADAFDYAQNGLITFIYAMPFVDGVENEEDEECVWSWDDTWNRQDAIDRVEAICPTGEVAESLKEAAIAFPQTQMKELKDKAKQALVDANGYAAIYGYYGTDHRGDYKYYSFMPIICKDQAELEAQTNKVMKTYHPAGSILTVYNQKQVKEDFEYSEEELDWPNPTEDEFEEVEYDGYNGSDREDSNFEVGMMTDLYSIFHNAPGCLKVYIVTDNSNEFFVVNMEDLGNVDIEEDFDMVTIKEILPEGNNEYIYVCEAEDGPLHYDPANQEDYEYISDYVTWPKAGDQALKDELFKDVDTTKPYWVLLVKSHKPKFQNRYIKEEALKNWKLDEPIVDGLTLDISEAAKFNTKEDAEEAMRGDWLFTDLFDGYSAAQLSNSNTRIIPTQIMPEEDDMTDEEFVEALGKGLAECNRK